MIFSKIEKQPQAQRRQLLEGTALGLGLALLPATLRAQLASPVPLKPASAAEVRAIMAAQASRAERLAEGDDVVRNDSGKESLEAQVGEIQGGYAEYSSQKPHVKC